MLGEGHAALTTLQVALSSSLLLVSLASINLGKALSVLHALTFINGLIRGAAAKLGKGRGSGGDTAHVVTRGVRSLAPGGTAWGGPCLWGRLGGWNHPRSRSRYLDGRKQLRLVTSRSAAFLLHFHSL